MGTAFSIATRDLAEGLAAWELWVHRGWSDVMRRYRRTILGPLWHTLSLAVFCFVMGVIWSVVLNTDFASYMRFLPVGLIVWSLISGIVTESCGSMIGASQIVLSLRFPYAVIPLSLVWKSLVQFGHHLLLYVAIVLLFGIPVGPATLLVVPGLAIVLVNGLWIALFLGTICLRFRDLQVLVGSLMQIAFFVTPVFWPRDMLGDRFAAAVDYNPLFSLVEVVRQPLLGSAPDPWNWFVAVTTAVVGWFLALLTFGAVYRRIPYWY